MIEFRELSSVTDFTYRHELGHIFGLEHHNANGLMSGVPFGNSTNPADHVFSLSERDNIAAMLKLAPNTPPPGASSTSFFGRGNTTRTEVLVD